MVWCGQEGPPSGRGWARVRCPGTGGPVAATGCTPPFSLPSDQTAVSALQGPGGARTAKVWLAAQTHLWAPEAEFYLLTLDYMSRK